LNEHPFVTADVFTDTPLEGNQLAVFTDGAAIPPELMQKLAKEMNYAESVFVLPPEKDGDARIRIFTPTRELPFAGHPVLGSAFVVGEPLPRDMIKLETGLGTISIELERDGDRLTFGRMEQAVPQWRAYERAEELLAAAGVERSALPVEAYPNGPLHVYMAVEGEQALAALEPDFAALADHAGVGANCFTGSGRSWRLRMFGPALGVDEDAASGSAAGPLAVHLARHGWIDFGDEIEIRQGESVGRPSKLYARAEGSPERIERVEVGGSAVIVASGVVRLP
jgi:trans-2,3-dihydro-3-hydroxyanthranilate isomerase